MNTVGFFAGRGDTIVALMLSGIIGISIGWYLRKFSEWLRKKLSL